MRKYFSVWFFSSAIGTLMLINAGYAQTGSWTWLKGDSTPLSYGHYGLMGVASDDNTPPALYEAASWTDVNGNLWLFGGVHYSNFNMYADLWKYSVHTNQWTWVKGAGIPNQPGIYGTQGVPAAGTTPGARAWGVATWVDPEGNLWLFGGSGMDHSGNYGRLNDLWKYEVISNEWTWMKGANTVSGPANYGTIRIESATNQIPARDESSCTWTINNEFWIFGGVINTGLYNDLWRYNWFTNNWTWMKGSTQLNRPPQHGLFGLPDEANDPGGRFVYCSWLNCDNNLLFFGGENSKAYNDLWLYDRVINNWVWVDGSSNPDQPGNYGEYCEQSEGHNPSARTENRARWRDGKGNLWLFGGFKMGAPISIYSDLWRYNPGDRSWALVHGNTMANLTGYYGLQSVAGNANNPRCRGGAVSWVDSAGNFWMFGGLTIENDIGGYPYVTLNDLWRYVPDDACFTGTACDLSVSPEISVSDTALCAGQCVDFVSQATISGVSFSWHFEGGLPETSSQAQPVGICYEDAGSFDVTLIFSHEGITDTLIFADYMHVYDFPDTPTITVSGNQLICTPSQFYQWQLNSVNIPGATNQNYIGTESGVYSVISMNEGGCWKMNSVAFELTSEQEVYPFITIYPNLTSSSITFSITGHLYGEEIVLNLYNLLGQQLYFFQQLKEEKDFLKSIDLSMLPAGLYIAVARSGSISQLEKIVLTR